MTHKSVLFRPQFDRLESRWTPAGTVTASLTLGTLTLTGDFLSNSIDISQTGFESYRITGDGISRTFSGVANITANLGGGNDTVTFGNQVPGAIAILGNLTINGGVGNNTVVSAGAVSPLTVGNNLSIANSTGNDSNILVDIRTGGSLMINNGAGDSTTTLRNDRGPGNFNSIAAALSIVNGTGADSNTIFDTNVGGNLSINDGSARMVDNLAGFNRIFNINNNTRATIGGSVSIANTNGNLPGFGDVVADVVINGNLTVNMGTGNVSGTIQAGKALPPPLVKGNLLITGSGSDQINLGSTVAFAGAGPGLTINGNLTINLTGTAAVSITTADLTVGHATAITTGGGADSVTLDDTSSAAGSQFLGSFSLNLGAGNDTVNLGNNAITSFFSTALFDGGSSNGIRLPGVNTLQEGANLSFILLPVFRNFP